MNSSGLPAASSGAASATASSVAISQSRVGLGEIAEHVAEHALLVAGMADAEPHPPVLRRAQHAVHAAQPVVPGRPAAALHPHLARRQVELVVERRDRLRRQLEERRRRLHALARLVHVGQRLERRAMRSPPIVPSATSPLKRCRHGEKPWRMRDHVERHEADVVALPGHARLGVAEADPEQHRATHPAYFLAAALARRFRRRLRRGFRRRGGAVPRPPRRRRRRGLGDGRLAPWSAAPRSRPRSRGRWITGRTPSVPFRSRPAHVVVDVERRRGRHRNAPARGPDRTRQSTAWRTTFSTPPRLMPGEMPSLTKWTVTATRIFSPAARRWKSTCSGRSVTGWNCTSRISARVGARR